MPPPSPEDLESVPTIEMLNELKRRHGILSRTPTRAIVLGPPCSGKRMIADHMRRGWGVCHITAADVKGAAEKAASAGMKGSADDRSISAVLDFLDRPQCRRGFVLEGFPSTAVQAQRLHAELEKRKTPLEQALVLEAPEETLLERCRNRLFDEKSGRRYNAESKPPMEAGVDDYSGAKLVQKHSDESFRSDAAQYGENAGHVLEYFARAGLAYSLPVTGSMDEVRTAVTELMANRQKSE